MLVGVLVVERQQQIAPDRIVERGAGEPALILRREAEEPTLRIAHPGTEPPIPRDRIIRLQNSRGHLGRRPLRHAGRQRRRHPQGLINLQNPSRVLGRVVIHARTEYAAADVGVDAVGRYQRYARRAENVVVGRLMLRLISAIDFAADQTLGIVHSQAATDPVAVGIEHRVLEPLKDPVAFGKHIEPRDEMVADPALYPNAQRIIRGLERRRDKVGLLVIQNIERGRAQAGKGLVEGFVDRTPAGELIVGNGINVWRRAKRIENDWDTARRRPRWTDRVVVEVERAVE